MPYTEFTDAEREIVRDTVKQSINAGLAGKQYSPDASESSVRLQNQGACFVTLMLEGRLRGCIGTLEAHQPLITDIAANAYSAAFRDPRFPPLDSGEWAKCDFSVSVLTSPQPLEICSEQDLLDRLRPGVDGVVLSCQHHRATYLPSVWEQLPDPSLFIRELKLKAGLSADFWSPEIKIEIYQTVSV